MTATGLLVVAAGFQASLAVGAPWGAAAFGGGHPGVLPTSLRGTSAAAVVVYSGLAYVVWSGRLAAPVQRRAYAILVGGVRGRDGDECDLTVDGREGHLDPRGRAAGLQLVAGAARSRP